MKKTFLAFTCTVLLIGCATNETSSQLPDTNLVASAASAGGGLAELPTLPAELAEQPPSDNATRLNDSNPVIYRPLYRTKPKAKPVVAKPKLTNLKPPTKPKLEIKPAIDKVAPKKSSKSVSKTTAKPKAKVQTTAKKIEKSVPKATSKLKNKPQERKTSVKKSGKPEHKVTANSKDKHKSKN